MNGISISLNTQYGQVYGTWTYRYRFVDHAAAPLTGWRVIWNVPLTHNAAHHGGACDASARVTPTTSPPSRSSPTPTPGTGMTPDYRHDYFDLRRESHRADVRTISTHGRAWARLTSTCISASESAEPTRWSGKRPARSRSRNSAPTRSDHDLDVRPALAVTAPRPGPTASAYAAPPSNGCSISTRSANPKTPPSPPLRHLPLRRPQRPRHSLPRVAPCAQDVWDRGRIPNCPDRQRQDDVMTAPTSASSASGIAASTKWPTRAVPIRFRQARRPRIGGYAVVLRRLLVSAVYNPRCPVPPASRELGIPAQTNDNCPLRHSPAACYIVHIPRSAHAPSFQRRLESTGAEGAARSKRAKQTNSPLRVRGRPSLRCHEVRDTSHPGPLSPSFQRRLESR